jgi:hypothetical protein
VPFEVKEYVFRYRKDHAGVGKECIKPELDKFCEKEGFDKISVSTANHKNIKRRR